MGEKTESASPRKLSEARNKGQIAKSQDLSAAVDLIGGAIIVLVFGSGLVNVMGGVMRRVLEHEAREVDTMTVGPILMTSFIESVKALGPVLGIVFLVAVGAQIMQVGFMFTTDPLRPKLERLDPIKGLGRLVQKRNLVKTIVNSVKLVAVLGLGFLYLNTKVDEVAALSALPLMQAFSMIVSIATTLATILLSLLLVIGLIDWLYQTWQHGEDLKMTKGEVKDERRSMEGDPKMKSKRMQMAREIALQRINSAVPKADVIVTNPTHYSVAIRYDAATMKAPKVVAKGVDYLAMRIRQVAAVHSIPIVERPPLARGLYASVEVGQEVSPEFYQAIAEILAFVYRLESQAA